MAVSLVSGKISAAVPPFYKEDKKYILFLNFCN